MLHASRARGPRELHSGASSATALPATSPLYALFHALRSAAASVAATVFPAPCRICGDPLENLSRLPVCDGCIASLAPMAMAAQGNFCEICGEGLASPWFPGGSMAVQQADALFADEPFRRCGLCQKAQPPYERAVAFASYHGAVRDLVHLLKYEHVLSSAQLLAELLAEALQPLLPLMAADTVVIPVPLHVERRRERGFNQSEQVLRALLDQLKLAPTGRLFHAGLDVLARTRATKSQTGLTRPQRKANVRGAFKAKNAAKIAGREVLLLDDVFTTGTTVAECARVLKRAGAKKVWVATVARVLKDGVSPPQRARLAATVVPALELPVAYRPKDPGHSGLF